MITYPPPSYKGYARQDRDGNAHLTYFDVRTQASFRWDAKQDYIEVGLGGYGEPVDHLIDAPNDYESDPFWVTVEAFEDTCQAHADELPDY